MSRYRVEFLKTAQKELLKLSKEAQQRIAIKIDSLAAEPYPPDTKKLKNGDGLLRIRVGDYRIIYRIEDERLIILIVKIGHRRDIYN